MSTRPKCEPNRNHSVLEALSRLLGSFEPNLKHFQLILHDRDRFEQPYCVFTLTERSKLEHCLLVSLFPNDLAIDTLTMTVSSTILNLWQSIIVFEETVYRFRN